MSTIRRRLIIAASQISKWLSKEACNTIKDAFGDDGKAVIKATDAYLDNLAPDKAAALAGYIAEDPMMVCGLWLNVQGVSMPYRKIKSNNGAYVLTDYIPNQKTDFLIRGRQAKTDSALFGLSSVFYCFDNNIDGTYAGFDSLFGMLPSIRIFDTPVRIVINKNDGIVINGYKYMDLTLATDFAANYGMALFARRNNTNGSVAKNGDGEFWQAEIKEDGVYAARFIASLHNGENGIYDIDAKKWFGNANSTGYFSISCIRNGQPWTPDT